MSERYILDGIKNLVPFVPYEKAVYHFRKEAGMEILEIGTEVQVGSVAVVKFTNLTKMTFNVKNSADSQICVVSLILAENADTITPYIRVINAGNTTYAGMSVSSINYALLFISSAQ